LSAARLIKFLQFSYSSKSVLEKTIFRIIRKSGAGHIVEFGVGSGRLGQSMIQQAATYTRRPEIRYTGIDLFELRDGTAEGMSLREAHRIFRGSGARVRLIPGDAATALQKHANTLLDSDLVVVHAEHLEYLAAGGWFYLPRMLHNDSSVVLDSAPTPAPTLLDLAAVQHRAAPFHTHRRAA